MKISVNILICLVSVILLFGCVRNGTPPNDDPHVINLNDTIFPVISITSPLPGQVYTNGETITIEGKVTDQGLYRGDIQIVNDANSSIIKDQPYEIHGLLEYNFSLPYKTSVSSITDYTITIWFQDHGLNITTKSVKVKVNP